jgi:hypothetical protein
VTVGDSESEVLAKEATCLKRNVLATTRGLPTTRKAVPLVPGLELMLREEKVPHASRDKQRVGGKRHPLLAIQVHASDVAPDADRLLFRQP